MRRLVLVWVGALAFAGAAQAKGTQGAATAAERSPLGQQLEPTLKGFQDAWNRHDATALAATFAEDGVLIDPSGRVARGRAEIAKLFEDQLQRGSLKGTELSQHLTDVRPIAPGWLFLDQELTISGARDPSGRPLPDRRVHGAILVSKLGEKWQVVEARAYAFTPPGSPGSLASTAGSGGGEVAQPRPQEMGTGSGAASSRALDVEDTAHTGP
jgi:uncharacterized protein (TIGR02246 family)